MRKRRLWLWTVTDLAPSETGPALNFMPAPQETPEHRSFIFANQAIKTNQNQIPCNGSRPPGIPNIILKDHPKKKVAAPPLSTSGLRYPGA